MRIKLISGQFCSRCHMIAPLLKKFCDENGHNFEELDVNNATPEDLWEASMLPVIWRGDEQIDFDEALSRISN